MGAGVVWMDWGIWVKKMGAVCLDWEMPQPDFSLTLFTKYNEKI